MNLQILMKPWSLDDSVNKDADPVDNKSAQSGVTRIDHGPR